MPLLYAWLATEAALAIALIRQQYVEHTVCAFKVYASALVVGVVVYVLRRQNVQK